MDHSICSARRCSGRLRSLRSAWRGSSRRGPLARLATRSSIGLAALACPRAIYYNSFGRPEPVPLGVRGDVSISRQTMLLRGGATLMNSSRDSRRLSSLAPAAPERDERAVAGERGQSGTGGNRFDAHVGSVCPYRFCWSFILTGSVGRCEREAASMLRPFHLAVIRCVAHELRVSLSDSVMLAHACPFASLKGAGAAQRPPRRRCSPRHHHLLHGEHLRLAVEEVLLTRTRSWK